MRTTLTIQDVNDMARLRSMEALQAAVWGNTHSTVVPAHLLVVVAHTGGIVLGAFDDDHLVGFAFGLLACEEERLYHASHMLGVHPAAQGMGVGAALKWRQRQRALEQGLDRMVWTFDPLEARNAHFNLHKLGVRSTQYRCEVYGEMSDTLNQGLPSDRLSVEWDLPNGDRPLGGLEGGDALTVLGSEGDRPILRIPDAPPNGPIRIGAPRSIQALKRADGDMALAWRLAQRQAFEWAFGQGFVACDFVEGAYFLVPDRGR